MPRNVLHYKFCTRITTTLALAFCMNTLSSPMIAMPKRSVFDMAIQKGLLQINHGQFTVRRHKFNKDILSWPFFFEWRGSYAHIHY